MTHFVICLGFMINKKTNFPEINITTLKQFVGKSKWNFWLVLVCLVKLDEFKIASRVWLYHYAIKESRVSIEVGYVCAFISIDKVIKFRRKNKDFI